MVTYFVVTAMAVAFAGLAGSRVLAGPTDTVLPRRKGLPLLFAAASCLALTMPAAFRYRVGTDYETYAENYDFQYRYWTWSQFTWDGEPGIRVLSWIAVRVHDDPATMFALAAIITVGLFMRTYAKYSTAFALSVLFFVLVGSWHGTFNGVRQFTAAAIVFAGHQLIIERRFVLYVLVVAFASLFHISALVLLLLYFVPRRQLSPLGLLALTVAALSASAGYDLAGSLIESIREDDLAEGSYFSRSINPLRIALAFVPYACYLLFARKAQLSERAHFYASVAFLHGSLLLAAAGSAHLARFAIYAAPFVALAIPAIAHAVAPRFRLLLVYTLLVVYAVFWYIDVSGSAALNPFRWLAL